MTPVEIVRQAQAEGVRLSVCDDGAIVIRGRESVARRWLQPVAERRADVVAVLREVEAPAATLGEHFERGLSYDEWCVTHGRRRLTDADAERLIRYAVQVLGSHCAIDEAERIARGTI